MISKFLIFRPGISAMIAAGMLGLLLGLLSVITSPLFLLVALFGVISIVIILKRPELGLLGYLILTSTIIRGDQNPHIFIGFGTIYLTDFILILLLSLILIRWLVEPGFRINRNPLNLPLIGFISLAMISTGLAILQERVTLQESLYQIRAIAGYLTFFIVVNLVREKRQIKTLCDGIIILACCVALAMIAQAILGTSMPILPGRVGDLRAEGEVITGVTRVIPPGESIVFLSFITLTAILMFKYNTGSTIGYFLWALLGVGFLLTFKRHLYLATFLGFLLLLGLTRKQDLRKLFGVGFVTTVLVAIILILSLEGIVLPGTRFINGVIARVNTLTMRSTYEDPNSSLRWRDFEYGYAFNQIINHPLLGIGLGARFRPFIPGRDFPDRDLTHFIHNGHLAIMMKEGLVGYAFLLCTFLIFFYRSFKSWKSVPDNYFRAILMGFTIALLGIIFGSNISPMVESAYWTPVVGIILGIGEVILAMAERENRMYPKMANMPTDELKRPLLS